MNTLPEMVLTTSDVSKIYSRKIDTTRLRTKSTLFRALLQQAYTPPEKPSANEFWALRDINFSLNRGETLGIIGLNGSGKTTLLRILSGQILPDTGEIKKMGTTAAMIDLTAGFQNNASGYENIFLRGAALGRSNHQMVSASDSIIEFAEIGEAINAPIATYSSGMMMRLAFSIMISATPDILLIDEVLAVGDFQFRQKCLAKMREMRETAAFVLVSHSMGDISRFCDQVLVMHQGRIIFRGPPSDAIKKYENLKTALPTKPNTAPPSKLGPQFINNNALREIDYFWTNELGEKITTIESGKDIHLCVSFLPQISIRNLVVGIPVWSEEGVYVTGFSTEITGDKFDVQIGKKINLRLEIPNICFNPGCYISNLTILDGPEFLIRKELPPIEITKGQELSWGAVTLKHSWHRNG